jgi:hypothetical protein
MNVAFDWFFRDRMTISEAVECLQSLDSDDEDGEIVENIFIQPPPGGCADSDADNGEEEHHPLGNLSENHRKAECQILVRNSQQSMNEAEIDLESTMVQNALEYDVLANTFANVETNLLGSSSDHLTPVFGPREAASLDDELNKELCKELLLL